MHFRDAVIPLNKQAGASDCVTWGLGLVVDGSLDIMGAWRMPSAEESTWIEVFEELRLRGVEKIRFVSGAVAQLPRSSVTSRVAIGQLDARFVTAPFSVRNADAAADRIEKAARRCVAREPICWGSVEASFVRQLKRAERSDSRARASLAAVRGHRLAVARVSSGNLTQARSARAEHVE